MSRWQCIIVRLEYLHRRASQAQYLYIRAHKERERDARFYARDQRPIAIAVPIVIGRRIEILRRDDHPHRLRIARQRHPSQWNWPSADVSLPLLHVRQLITRHKALPWHGAIRSRWPRTRAKKPSNRRPTSNLTHREIDRSHALVQFLRWENRKKKKKERPTERDLHHGVYLYNCIREKRPFFL